MIGKFDLPSCPECGRLAEDIGDGDIYCEHCYRSFCDWMWHILGAEVIAEISAQIKQDAKLGVGLDCTPEVQ